MTSLLFHWLLYRSGKDRIETERQVQAKEDVALTQDQHSGPSDIWEGTNTDFRSVLKGKSVLLCLYEMGKASTLVSCIVTAQNWCGRQTRTKMHFFCFFFVFFSRKQCFYRNNFRMSNKHKDTLKTGKSRRSTSWFGTEAEKVGRHLKKMIESLCFCK